MGQIHNELLRAHEIRAGIRDALEISEGDINVERLGETLTPILDIWSQPEWSFNRNEIRFSVRPGTAAAGGAGLFGFIQFFNPVGSNRIYVIEKYFDIAPGANRQITIALTATVRGASFDGAIALDTRFSNPIVGAGALQGRDPLSCSQGAVAVFTNDTIIHQATSSATAGAAQELGGPVVILGPGSGVVMSDGTANEAFTAWVTGRGRPARLVELG